MHILVAVMILRDFCFTVFEMILRIPARSLLLFGNDFKNLEMVLIGHFNAVFNDALNPDMMEFGRTPTL